MLKGLSLGKQFYYADRNEKKPVKCIIKDIQWGYPCKIKAEREDTKKVFTCYEGFGCYELEQYQEAFEDSQIQSNRIIY